MVKMVLPGFLSQKHQEARVLSTYLLNEWVKKFACLT